MYHYPQLEDRGWSNVFGSSTPTARHRPAAAKRTAPVQAKSMVPAYYLRATVDKNYWDGVAKRVVELQQQKDERVRSGGGEV